MNEVCCALCGSEDRRPLHEVTRYREPIRIVRCGACGHVFRSPRPSNDEVDGYYDADYYSGRENGNRESLDDGSFRFNDEREGEARVRVKARQRLATMERVLGGTGRLLEVGCAFGLFLDEARTRGWTTVGVDVSAHPLEHARGALGLDVRKGRVEDLDEPDGSFDAAYFSETIEHLADPMRALRRLATLLREGGLLVAGTGNVSSLAARSRGARWGYYMPGHLHYFSIRTLRHALRRAGFSEVRIRVPDDRGLRAAWAAAPAEGRGRLRAALAWLARAPRIGALSVGAGMVAYARRRP